MNQFAFAQSKLLDHLGITVTPLENREFSYTDKQSAYFYGRTHKQVNDDWFSGWNIGTHRIFQDYELYIDGKPLQRAEAQITVYPDRLQRYFPDAEETFMMFDNKHVLSIELANLRGNSIGLSIEGYLSGFLYTEENMAFYIPKEAPTAVLVIAPIHPAPLKEINNYLESNETSGGFFIVYAESVKSAKHLIIHARNNYTDWKEERRLRMEHLIAGSFTSSDSSTDKALQWITLTLDQLITHQSGDGIYAGLPWFNDYWGRDTFISLAGACLVTGQFKTARKILTAFAHFQNSDSLSKNFGRVPNRIRPDDVIYNTTDGTPRFVMALYEYVMYSGDTSLIKELYPVIQRSIEGPLKYWVDIQGYLTHEEADTWMDAKIDGKVPYSPRGNRANDVQWLWYENLIKGSFFARFMKQETDAERWKVMAQNLQFHFINDFINSTGNELMADHLHADGSPDFTVRPNQFFAMALINDRSLRMQLTRKTWEALVYPWGVASLAQTDSNFHPFHEYPEYYPKDEAYHNGTVWVWNNGIAIQRLLEFEQIAPSWNLFQGMTRQALMTGAVGSLSENMDALPGAGSAWANKSGTFLQAWSNAEYLRVWNQYFLGIRPNAIEKKIEITPLIPATFSSFQSIVSFMDGRLESDYIKQENKTTYQYQLIDASAVIVFKLPDFPSVETSVATNDKLEIVLYSKILSITLKGMEGNIKLEKRIAEDLNEVTREKDTDRIFQGIHFTQPYLNPGLKCLQKSQK
ncbi:MAG: hypothetical protein H0W62_05955 [Chitinophagales bacterium]|nr:hypothetical protein [Chitinophagales bacterium]